MEEPAAWVTAAADEMLRVLGPVAEVDWGVAAGGVDWTCRDTAAHVAHDLLSYAAQVVAQPTEGYLGVDLRVRPHVDVAGTLAIVRTCATLLADAVEARPTATAWHWGTADASAFAALGVGEILVHTFDITAGLGVDWTPPESLATIVIERLLPDAPAGPAPAVLLWSTGRASLDGRPPSREWVWRAAR